MPKSQFIDEKTVRKSGWIKYQDTPVNQYKKTIEEEKENFTTEDLDVYKRQATSRSLRAVSPACRSRIAVHFAVHCESETSKARISFMSASRSFSIPCADV